MYLGQGNKGSYIEKLVDNSANHYLNKGIMLIQKKHVPFFFKSDNKGAIKKSTTDYYALYKGNYFDFEVKQTENDFFLTSQVKKHQASHLNTIDKYGGFSFVMLHFFKHDLIYAIPFSKYKKLKSRLTIDECKKYFIEVNVIFPGIIDFEHLFNLLSDKKI